MDDHSRDIAMSFFDRRGFSLLEVILAIALLSALMISVLPLLTEATQVTASARHAVAVHQLAHFADEVLDDESLASQLLARSLSTIPWSAEAEVRAVEVRHIAVTDKELPHEWIEFSCNGIRVLRYLPREFEKREVAAMSRESPP